MTDELIRVVRELQAKRVGKSSLAQCPAHNDYNPSLSIREVGGRILVHCHAGCEQRDVIAALKDLGLWDNPATAAHPTKRIVAEYSYTDECGNLLYQVIRLDPKAFFQRYPDGKGGWIWKKHRRQVLYRLAEVIQSPVVFVVEGEKDVESLRACGFVATTNAGGAKAAWLPSYTEILRGREVVIVPDMDPPGRERGKRVARALVPAAARVLWWEPEGAKDITEWFEQGHSEIELIECISLDEVRR
jgi:putative DNA primase/helicase